MPIRNMGWKKDKRDERDYLHKRRAVVLPEVVDNSPFLPSVRDQGNLGSCVGFGVAGNLTALMNSLAGKTDSEWFSPTWVYNGARSIYGDLPYDDGAYPRDAFEWIRGKGCLLEHFRPYHDTLDKTDPATWVFDGKSVLPEAAKYPILEYVRVVDSVEGIKDALASGYYVSIGTPWFSDWMNVGYDGVLPEVFPYSSVVGGHETFLYGYDNTRKLFYGQNSWGKDWGKSGRYLLPFSSIEVFKDPSLGGYDAHYVKVNWVQDTPVPPTPIEKHYIALAKSTDSGKTWKIIIKVRV